MVLHNPNNWHWVNKDVSGWTKEYLSKDLVGIKAEKDGATAEISKLLSQEGDVEVAQRKGKVITIFDLKLQLEYTGKTKEDENVSGTITVPEVAHDTEEDEYVFEIEMYSESSSKTPVKDLVRSQITSQLRARFQQLGPALMETHAKDIQHAAGHKPGFTPAKVYSSSSVNKQTDESKSSTATSTSSGKGPAVNVTSLSDQQEFRCDAPMLFQILTDPQRIAAFTRAPPKIFEGARPGGKFEIFGGNVSGEYVELSEPTKIVQKWRLAQWPQGHYSTLNIAFEQNNVDAVTIMRVDWTGVPVGEEEATKRNWENYYVRSMKQTFGIGSIL
jgi:activator of HSP90 ATPase